MKLIVYKGFDIHFLKSIKTPPLVDNNRNLKVDILSFDRKTRKQLGVALINLEETDEAWVTYEEYSLIKNQVDEAIDKDGLEVLIYKNNLYPDYYPIPFPMSAELAKEIINVLSGNIVDELSEECRQFISIYNTLVNAEGVYYGGFYNYEYDKENGIPSTDFYPSQIEIENDRSDSDYNVFFNDDIETYLRDLARIIITKPAVVGIRSSKGDASKRLQLSLQAYCVYNQIRLIQCQEQLQEDCEMEKALFDIAKNDIGVPGFSNFRKIKFYSNPDIGKDVVEISQGQIIQEIIRQAENSYNVESTRSFRDIFITASTGAGKSVMFQIPAVYLAKKYKKLTIIIEPVKALMQDQKEKLNKNGYMRVEAFNSDLISQVEKETVLRKIKDGEVDLLYLSPETLLSYSIETIIGDREIGLLIVDEAHIVTTWGIGFRPDYWYLGGYISKLRNQIQTTKGMQRRTYKFPICAFTATAVNGGIDDSVSDTIVSLYMENPIKYIGYVRRDDIRFDIKHMETQSKLPKSEYEEAKTKALNNRIQEWLSRNEKTIVYFPYASLAGEASKGVKGFSGITVDKRIGTYTGRNIDELSQEAFNAAKRHTFEGFRDGTTPIMFATKAFGMGVDVDDVQNVYHYAVTGSLCDYVQEIGRAARKASMVGTAITDNFYNDMIFMKVLFGMSQIKTYQIKAVLAGIYNAYKSKNKARSFLISPEAFTYIFNGKGARDEDKCINKLKTCLLMLEKDFYDKYNFKVIISRPQSVFTKAFVCVAKEHEQKVLNSQYGPCFTFVEKGRYQEKQIDGTLLSDVGDIYILDLKKIWENFYSSSSFPQFKYWYFNPSSASKDKIVVMPEVRDFFSSRQKINIEVRKKEHLGSVRAAILDDFEFIANTLYDNFGRSFFTVEDVVKLLRPRFGIVTARIIANSLFDLVDPNGKCVKRRASETVGKSCYSLSNGNFKELMRRPILKSKVVSNISRVPDAASYSSYLSLNQDETSTIALKLLSVFDYITYEVTGGAEPEIFIRLNDPNKIESIVMGNTYYANNYVARAKQKHIRDIEVLLQFFNGLTTDKERWDYIENYFLGNDVLCGVEQRNGGPIKMEKSIDKEHSCQVTMSDTWEKLAALFDENDMVKIKQLIETGVSLPEYLQTEIKKSDVGNDIMMSWPSKETLICQQDTPDSVMEFFKSCGWHAYRIDSINYDAIKRDLECGQ